MSQTVVDILFCAIACVNQIENKLRLENKQL
jgi:hypothetical protein